MKTKAHDVTEIILESISDGVFTVDHEWRITSFNLAAETITGIEREEALGKNCWDVFRSNMCETDCALKRTMKEGKSFIDSQGYIVTADKRRVPVVVCTSPLKDGEGKLMGGVETFRDVSLVEELRKELDKRYQVGDMVSRSPLMQSLFQHLPQIAESDSSVLVNGETGTGKELLARAIHDLSDRQDQPFFAVNCGALPDSLLESELFGYKSGAFTNATKDKPGYFALAHRGTLFLDEIGDVSPAFQVRLLRVLQDGKFLPLGASKSVTTDVRLICATNKDLEGLVNKGEFREDLFYRVNVIRMELPPLRQRKEDIPLLVERFIERLNFVRNKNVSGISHEALAQLMNHRYPGNIRELENIIEHAFAMSHQPKIETSDLPDSLKPAGRPDVSMSMAMKTLEGREITDALKRNQYNRLATARDLGIHKSTLFRKIKALGINLPPIDGRHKQESE